MRINYLFWAAIMGLTGVAMGAFGAHALRDSLTPQMLAAYKTAVDYQMWHALGLALIAILQYRMPTDKLLHWAGILMLAGIMLFSGSLYLLTISGLRYLGMITPIGGIALLSSWALLAISSYKK